MTHNLNMVGGGTAKEPKLFFTLDVAPRRASNRLAFEQMLDPYRQIPISGKVSGKSPESLPEFFDPVSFELKYLYQIR